MSDMNLKVVVGFEGKAVAAGAQATAADLKAIGDAAGASAAKASAALQRAGVSAAQTAAALRNVPAQMTDIFVGLTSGQSPLTVLLQQGGQLKDMFGGIGPAARALGGYVAGLVNPFTVAAAAAGALALAYYQGSKEADAYRNALILTGNAAGSTASRLEETAKRVAAATGATQGAVADALAQSVGTAKITGDNLALVSQAAISMQRATGRAVEETVAEFAQLGRSPVEASLKINESTRHLTATVYEQIKALQDQGRTAEAAALAQKAYADTLIERSGAIRTNLGTLESAWRSITDGAKAAWDAMLGVGREDSLAEKIAGAERNVEALRSRVTALQGGGIGDSPFAQNRAQALKDAEAELVVLRARQTTQNLRADSQGKAGADEQAGIKRIAEIDAFLKKYKSKTKEMAEEIENARRLLSGDKLAEVEAEIRKKYREPVGKKSSRKAFGGIQDEEDVLYLIQESQRLRNRKAFDDADRDAAKQAADQQARLNTLIAATPTGKLEAAREEMQFLAASLETAAITEEQFLEAVGLHYGQAAESIDEMSQFTIEAARNMQDAMADGFFDIMQGKFDNLGRSFKATLDRMVANAIAADLSEAMFGNFGKTGKIGGWAEKLLNMLPGGGGGESGSLDFAAEAAAFIDPFAAGGVLRSAGLHPYANTIVSSPTLFKFAQGGAFSRGLMGESGPEAIMPLTRGPDGRLGVQASGGANITVIVQGATNAPDVRRAAGQGAREALTAFSGAQRYG